MARKKKKADSWTASNQIDKTDWWNGLTVRTRHVIAISFLFLVSFGYFASMHTEGNTIVGGDTVNFQGMAESMLTYKAETGEEALWATNMFSGMPGYLIKYNNLIPQADDILRFTRPLLWPSAYLFAMILGVYALVYYLTQKGLAALVASVAFGFTTYIPIIIAAGHNSKVVALAYAPWLLLAFIYAVEKPGLFSSLLFAIATAVQIRAGHVQITYYIVVLAIVWWIVEAVRLIRAGQTKEFGILTGWLVLGSGLALLMVAQPLWTTYQYKAFTIRGSSAGGVESAGLAWDYAMGWSQGIGELVTLLVADGYGGGGQGYWGAKAFTAGPHYLGGVVILLAILATWKVRRRGVVALAIAGFLMILFALGINFSFLNRLMFDYFPMFSSFRVPETWLVIVALITAILAGLGVSWIVDEALLWTDKQRKSVFMSFAGMLAFIGALYLMPGSLFDFQKPNENQQVAQAIAQQNNVAPSDPRVTAAVDNYLKTAKTERIDKFTTDAGRTFFFLLIAIGFISLYTFGKIPAWVMQVGLVLIVLIDLWGVDRRYLNADHWQSPKTAAESVKTYAFDRFIKQQTADAGGLGYFRSMSLESGPFTNSRPSFHYESIGGYHAAKLRIYQDFIENVITLPNGGINPNALDLLSVKYVINRGPLPGSHLAYQDEQTGLNVYERLSVLDRAILIDSVAVISEPEAIWEELRSPDFNPSDVALVRETLPFSDDIDSTLTNNVTLKSFGPKEIIWEVESNREQLLMVSEIYYPAGWKAFVDEHETPILQTNYALRGVVVPQGKHQIKMTFAPATHIAGLWIAGITTFLVYGLAIFLGYAKFTGKEADPTLIADALASTTDTI